ncbi:MAG TPA: cytochrome c peroxidase [Bryobacteraceae bacterium]|nr:cytochrome c peroxidase [Bryobacteraceae bacterium]
MPAELAEGAGIIRNRQAAIALGKALFWDQQAGSDNTACASCHYNAGADTRITNALNPGSNDITANTNGTENTSGNANASGDFTFGSNRSDTGSAMPGHMLSGAKADSNYTLKPSDFPMHKLSDETDRDSALISTTNDRVGSQGTFDGIFDLVRRFGRKDRCSGYDAEVFHAGMLPARQVTARNSPSVIDAVFNHRQFWDGRANNMFNGVGVFGMRDITGDVNKRLIVADARGRVALGYLTIPDASLASQALAPVVSAVEMSCDGRTMADIGKKMLETWPLERQTVDASDSVLGRYASRWGNGLRPQYTYAALIRAAFDPKYWAAGGKFLIGNGQLKRSDRGYTQMETNFSMFWGISIMMYESTLVSDQSEYDTLVTKGLLKPVRNGCTADASVDPLLARGCNLFFEPPPVLPIGGPNAIGGGCALCHSGSLFSEAALTADQTWQPFVQAPEASGRPALHETGFFNIGATPVFSDRMVGGTDSYGHPLSYGRQLYAYFAAGKDLSKILDPDLKNAIANNTLLRPAGGPPGPLVAFGPAPSGNKLEVDGASKVPILRNVALTPPYFSYGGYATLRQVMKSYNHGLNSRRISGANSPDAHGNWCTAGDDSGTGPDGNQNWPLPGPDCGTNLPGILGPLHLLDCDANGQTNPTCVAEGKNTTNDDLAALVRFMLSLTDKRVQCDAAPFDHPELKVIERQLPTDRNINGRADDVAATLPAVGASGYKPRSGFCIPNSGDLFAPGMQARSGGTRVPLN